MTFLVLQLINVLILKFMLYTVDVNLSPFIKCGQHRQSPDLHLKKPYVVQDLHLELHSESNIVVIQYILNVLLVNLAIKNFILKVTSATKAGRFSCPKQFCWTYKCLSKKNYLQAGKQTSCQYLWKEWWLNILFSYTIRWYVVAQGLLLLKTPTLDLWCVQRM